MVLLPVVSQEYQSNTENPLFYGQHEERNEDLYCEFGTLDQIQATDGTYEPACFDRNKGKEYHQADGTVLRPFLKHGSGGFNLYCPEEIGNGTLEESCSRRPYKNCSYTCDDGFSRASDWLKCLEKGPSNNVSARWDKHLPCVPLKPDPKEMEHTTESLVYRVSIGLGVVVIVVLLLAILLFFLRQHRDKLPEYLKNAWLIKKQGDREPSDPAEETELMPTVGEDETSIPLSVNSTVGDPQPSISPSVNSTVGGPLPSISPSGNSTVGSPPPYVSTSVEISPGVSMTTTTSTPQCEGMPVTGTERPVRGTEVIHPCDTPVTPAGQKGFPELSSDKVCSLPGGFGSVNPNLHLRSKEFLDKDLASALKHLDEPLYSDEDGKVLSISESGHQGLKVNAAPESRDAPPEGAKRVASLNVSSCTGHVGLFLKQDQRYVNELVSHIEVLDVRSSSHTLLSYVQDNYQELGFVNREEVLVHHQYQRGCNGPAAAFLQRLKERLTKIGSLVSYFNETGNKKAVEVMLKVHQNCPFCLQFSVSER
ncbi:uncharacterized protein LOC101847721 [Aplysia californica]|uniref:Uncharacterized protein LOC101847721 n=1 Tax=Aplysia californica TaxID=6500 RepID=A0ABM0ZZ34_APLCA|nr:uncharacterized protein LOC101847721 [Aplysia californica]